MAPRPPSAVTRSIYLGTFAAIAVVATLSVAIYRSAVNDTVTAHANQQLAMVRTAAVGIEGEIDAQAARLRQFASLPSVQNLDVEVLSQRVAAAFGDNRTGLINLVVRVDANGRLHYWTPNGEYGGRGTSGYRNQAIWQWASDRANANHVRMVHGWANSITTRRALVLPVWRTAPSAEHPKPPNDFAGVIALVIDINRFVEHYLGPAMSDLADEHLVVGLATPEMGVRMGPGRGGLAPTPADAHGHAERQGTMVLDDAEGRRLHAWAKLRAADQTWLVASSVRYSFVAGQIQRSAMAQLALTSMLLVAVPVAGWLIARRERHVQQEQRHLERRLAQSQKMEAIGKLAGGIAHDFNNMLTAILGYASMIQEDAPPRSAIRDQALQIRRAAENAAALTQKLLAFSRKQVLQPHVIDLRSMLGNLLPLLRRAVGEDVNITTQVGEDLWPIVADQSQVEQSIVNLAINAREAMPEGGTLQITVRNASRPHGERRPDVDVKAGDYVQITVTDTGVGMDEATRTRMFEPFFTTKAPGTGTGLGLSTVYGFVRQCGGYISVLSTPGKGTSIELLLPRADVNASPAAATPASLVQGPGAPGRETVLVAEDEESVRLLTVQSLERHGYRVLAADSGEAALKIASTFDGTIDLLVSDVVMPGMKGPELAERLRAMRPGVRVLLMSGYAADVVTPNDLREAALLSKPFSPAALTKAVRAALDHRLPSERA
ncbi:MAG TPA: ATP-binding protein [Vicinamibacterales bacterium]|nr:ATP-binding protein [Vicinamibacterales bacterium]